MKADCSQFNWVHEFPIIFTKRIISKIESACFKRDCKEMTLCRDNQYFIIVLFIDFIISKQESSSLKIRFLSQFEVYLLQGLIFLSLISYDYVQFKET
jgi:hypothetical protein